MAGIAVQNDFSRHATSLLSGVDGRHGVIDGLWARNEEGQGKSRKENNDAGDHARAVAVLEGTGNRKEHGEGQARAEVEGAGVHAGQVALVIGRREHNTQAVKHDIGNAGVGYAQENGNEEQGPCVRGADHEDGNNQANDGADEAGLQDVLVAQLGGHPTGNRAED